MPFYEYKCKGCNTVTEVLRPIKFRDEPTYCDSCGAATERILSRFNTAELTVADDPRKGFDADPAHEPRGTAVRLENEASATFKHCAFQGFQTGISLAKGSKLSMDGNKFENVKKPIEVTVK